MAVWSFLLGVCTIALFMGKTECSHESIGKYCYYSMNYFNYYCENKCDTDPDIGPIIGIVIGGVVGLAIIIGITICASLSIYNKRQKNVRPGDGGFIFSTNRTYQPRANLVPNGVPSAFGY
ncbi:uncharacterized protein LOC125656954 [Ostrea edulis]|uniref:uncharacterized protein LOC125656954 n=1 Tax=Ostrea edulis TaxID=37623 RepID=UPI0024AF1D61|nr:uncharacterized protein LOC125656954 [Ostrea edulis]